MDKRMVDWPIANICGPNCPPYALDHEPSELWPTLGRAVDIIDCYPADRLTDWYVMVQRVLVDLLDKSTIDRAAYDMYMDGLDTMYRDYVGWLDSADYDVVLADRMDVGDTVDDVLDGIERMRQDWLVMGEQPQYRDVIRFDRNHPSQKSGKSA